MKVISYMMLCAVSFFIITVACLAKESGRKNIRGTLTVKGDPVVTNAQFEAGTNQVFQDAEALIILSTNGLVTQTITNGLAGSSITNGFVTQTITNGLAGSSITNGFVTQTITNGVMDITVTNEFVTQTITNGGFVTESITNGVVDSHVNTHIIHYGGILDALGKLANVNGASNLGTTAALNTLSEAIIMMDGNLETYGWNSTGGDATTIVKIYTNGVVAVTRTLTGVSGIDSGVSIPVVEGCKIAFEGDAGTAMGASTITILLEF